MKYRNDRFLKLIHSVVDGNADDFDFLYKEFSGFVYHVALSVLCDAGNSNDVTQEVFIKLFRLGRQNVPASNPIGWLYSMTKNESLLFIRRQKPTLNIDDYMEDYNEAANRSMEEALLSEMNFYDCLKCLNAKKREIVILKVADGLSHRQIAKILNIPQGTVQWTYREAIRQLETFFMNGGAQNEQYNPKKNAETIKRRNFERQG